MIDDRSNVPSTTALGFADKFASAESSIKPRKHGDSEVDLPSRFRTRLSYKRMMLRLRH
jgi:hypothetical protein